MRLAPSLLAAAALALLGPSVGARRALQDAAPEAKQDSAEGASFRSALAQAQSAFEQGRIEEAARLATRALERDRRAPEAWALRAAVAAKLGDQDLAIHALHTELALLVAQRA